MQNVTRPDGQPVNVTFTAGLPGPFDGPCIFLLDDGSIHAGDVLRSSKTFPSGAISTTNPAGGLHEKFEIPLCRVIGWADAGRRDRKAGVAASVTTVIQASDIKLAAMNTLHDCGVTVHDILEAKDFLAICDEHGLLAEDGSGGAYTEAQLLQAYADLLVEILTYNQLLGRYRKLLEANPGKALFIGRYEYAALDKDAYLYRVHRYDGESFSTARAYDFYRDAYNTCTGGWDSESFVETWQHIQAPVFVDLVDRMQGW